MAEPEEKRHGRNVQYPFITLLDLAGSVSFNISSEIIRRLFGLAIKPQEWSDFFTYRYTP
jgi:hypothetical protein